MGPICGIMRGPGCKIDDAHEHMGPMCSWAEKPKWGPCDHAMWVDTFKTEILPASTMSSCQINDGEGKENKKVEIFEGKIN